MSGNDNTMPKARRDEAGGKMTIAERMGEALALGRRFPATQTRTKGK